MYLLGWKGAEKSTVFIPRCEAWCRLTDLGKVLSTWGCCDEARACCFDGKKSKVQWSESKFKTEVILDLKLTLHSAYKWIWQANKADHGANRRKSARNDSSEQMSESDIEQKYAYQRFGWGAKNHRNSFRTCCRKWIPKPYKPGGRKNGKWCSRKSEVSIPWSFAFKLFEVLLLSFLIWD